MLDPELREDVGEMSFDGSFRQVERRGNLPVRPALGHERSHPLLGGRELAGARRATADSLELSAGALGPELSFTLSAAAALAGAALVIWRVRV